MLWRLTNYRIIIIIIIIIIIKLLKMLTRRSVKNEERAVQLECCLYSL